jgi:hypothetical protein
MVYWKESTKAHVLICDSYSSLKILFYRRADQWAPNGNSPGDAFQCPGRYWVNEYKSAHT